MSKNSSNTVQAFWVSSGSLFAFGFSIISSMILSRYFTKEDYGTYKQVIYVYNTLLTVFTLGLPKAYAYFLPRVNMNEAKNLIRKLTSLFFVLGIVFSLTLFLFSSQIALFLKNPDLELAIKIFSPVPLLLLPTMGLDGILSTYRMNKFMAIYTISTRLFQFLCVALPVILFDGGYIDAIIGFVISSFISFLLALYLKNLPVKNETYNKTSIKFKEILKFSLPLLTASIWGILISSADQFFISRFFGPAVFAEFANGSLELPFVGMIIGATSTVLLPVFSKQIYDKTDPKEVILPLWTSVFEKSVKLIYPLVLYFWIFADIVMVVLYGDMYVNSATYFRIKLFVEFFRVIVFAPLIISIGATKFYSNVHMYLAIILILSEYISILIFNSPYVITLISTICNIGKIIVFLLFISKFFKIKLYNLFPIKTISKIFFPTVLILLFIRFIFIEIIAMDGLLVLIVTFISFAFLFFFWCNLVKVEYMTILNPLLLSIKKKIDKYKCNF